MGKKTDTSKQAGDAARASKPVAKKAKKATVAAVDQPVTPATPKPVKAAAKKPAKVSAVKKPAYTQDDIALRAYFIAEKRQKAGLPGDSTSDWIEAERQLLAESKKKPAPTGA